jgi:hypothetical protein
VPIICEDAVWFWDLKGKLLLTPMERIPGKIRQLMGDKAERKRVLDMQRSFRTEAAYSRVARQHFSDLYRLPFE